MAITVRDIIRTVPAASARPVGDALYGLVKFLQPDTLLEVGTWLGHSALHMALACAENGRGRIYCVDNWSLHGGDRQQLEQTLQITGLDRHVRLVEGDSLQVPWPPVLDFVFLDGNHSYAYVKAETEKAMALQAQVIVLDDSTEWEAIGRYVDELRDTMTRHGYDVAEFIPPTQPSDRLRRAEQTMQGSTVPSPDHGGLTILTRRTPRPKGLFSEAEFPKGYIEQ